MIAAIVISLALNGVIIALRGKEVRQANRTTRWVFYSLLGLSTGLFLYVSSELAQPRPGTVLLWLLEPFDPIQ